MSSNTKKRIEQIDIARGIAAICMILGHSFIVHPIDISNVGWCRALHLWIYSFHMELFFFLTGAVWSCRNFSEYIKKSMRVLVPYVAFGCLSILLRMMGTSLVNNNESLGEGVTNFIFRGGWILVLICPLLYVFVVPRLRLCGTKNESSCGMECGAVHSLSFVMQYRKNANNLNDRFATILFALFHDGEVSCRRKKSSYLRWYRCG